MVDFLSTMAVNLNEKGAAGFPATPSKKAGGWAAGLDPLTDSWLSP
jgi:hypothetical protein